MASRNNIFTTIRTEGALLPADLLQRISEGATLDGLTPESYHRPGEKLNEAINRSWNALQGVWASFRAAQERLPENDLGTTITRERWLLPLFRELDYGRLQTATAVEIDGRSYPISHGWEHVPLHLVSYKLDLDKRTPGAAGASTASPHSLLQVFLNRSEDNLWGFLSNGYKLRILRDNVSLTRQAYVEFDLEAMMEGEVYSDFVLLWLLCHQSRVEGERLSDCWLEKWMKVAEDQGTRALDQLRDGVEAAITALGLGFLEYPANAALRDKLTSGELNAQDYYRQLLRMVYRLLFLFVAEDRDLLLNPAADIAVRERYIHYYSTQRLRHMAETFKGTRHPDLFEGLRLVMRLLSGESPHPKSFSQGEKDLLRRGTQDAERYENIASQTMVHISRELRQRQTSAEEIVWEALRDHRLNNLKFRRQHPIANTQYVADFMCYEAKLVVEIDGSIHLEQQAEDTKRQSDIETLGYRVIRFTNEVVQTDFKWVLASIAHAAQLPSPKGRRAGDEGYQGLGLVPLGSFLFSDRAVTDVIGCQIANSHLLDAIRALSLTYDGRAQVYRTVDYKNLGSDELGSIFESLLELHPQINVPARRFALSTAAGNERKTTGSYYTPESLVHALLDSALNPVLAEAIKGTNKPPSPTLPPHGEGSKERVREMATKTMRNIARDLRQRQTPAEEILWEALRKNRLGGLGFRRQHPVANTSYVVDFFCYSEKLIVELDGKIHQFQQKQDAQRQTELEALGYRVLRFSNESIINDLENVLVEILSTTQLKVPPPEGEGFRVGATAEERILALKVCDPACGSGHFLIAAANRMAKALAFVRTGEEEPPPAAIQEAKRDIISHCIYGVDINPMAVELCKVNLWMEAMEPGKPLNFLDHRIQVGNSLLGTTPKLMAGGIPDDAFNPIEGDDKQYASTIKKLNKKERENRKATDGARQMDLFGEAPRTADYSHLTEAMHALDDTPDDTLDGIRRKEAQYAALASDPEYIKARLLADAWCAAFVWEKRSPHPKSFSQGEQDLQSTDSPPSPLGRRAGDEGISPLPMTDLLYRRMEDNPLADNLQTVRETVVALTDRYAFFHWHVAFPDVFSVEESPHPKSFSQGAKDLQSGDQLPSTLGRGAGGEGYNEQTGWHGGFDCVLGNPPWERIKIQEKEWFAERAPEIANASNASTRRKAIAELAESNPYLLQAFADDKRKAEGESHFVRVSERYPLCGRGDVNTYTIFAETSRYIINGYGRVGMIVPSGIATDDTTKFFFQDLMQTRSLASLYDFENREGIFEGVHRSYKFCLLTLTAPIPGPSPSGRREQVSPPEGGRFRGGAETEFVFFALNVAELKDDWRRFTLSATDIAALNPNTGTTATFRSKRDAEITKAIYRRVPVLMREEPLENAWGISFLRMFDMSNDSGLFRTRAELESAGFALQGNHFVRSAPTLNPSPSGGGTSSAGANSLPHEGEGQGMGAKTEVYLPLYEAKLMHQFTHRWATYVDDGSTRGMTLDELGDPTTLPMPRYWVDEREVAARLDFWNQEWLLGFRDIARSTDERTSIFSLLPRVAVGHKAPLAFIDFQTIWAPAIMANADSFVFDYIARQKICGTNLAFFYLKQLPLIPPHTYTRELLDFIVPRVLELTYTAWDLQPFAQDVGYDGAPFVWDEERRFLMRCELDALYFHLYQIQRDDVDYIMDTFPIVKRKDIKATSDENGEGGEYLIKRVILEIYDQMAGLALTPVPSPKGRGENEGTYLVPDVSQWVTWLNPPPTDPSVAHQDTR